MCIQLDAIRACPRRWYIHQADLPGLGIQMPDQVALLQREPDVAIAGKHHRVRITGGRCRHRIFLYLSVGRIEPADVCIAVTGIPDETIAIDDQVVRVGSALDFVALELTGFGNEISDVIAALATKPDPAFIIDIRIARYAAFPWHQPFPDVQRLGRLPCVDSKQHRDKQHRMKQDFHVGISSFTISRFLNIAGVTNVLLGVADRVPQPVSAFVDHRNISAPLETMRPARGTRAICFLLRYSANGTFPRRCR